MVTIEIEVVLGAVALLAGSFLWQLWKRNQFLQRAIHDTDFLARLISPKTLDNPPSRSSPYLQELPQGYPLNLQLVIRADRKSTRFSKLIFGTLAIAALIGSYFLGFTYLVINVAIFLLAGLARVSEQARANAAQHILAIAVILDRWRTQNFADCETWIKQAWSLRPLYDAVIAARTSARTGA